MSSTRNLKQIQTTSFYLEENTRVPVKFYGLTDFSLTLGYHRSNVEIIIIFFSLLVIPTQVAVATYAKRGKNKKIFS